MERSVVTFDTKLPGYDTQQSIHLTAQGDSPFAHSREEYRYLQDHRAYLNNPTYHKYLQMHKVFVGGSGAQELITIADELEHEELPRYLDAAGWAYAEAGLVLADESTVKRIELIKAAEQCWERSLQAGQYLLDERAPQFLYEDAAPYRTALNLAFTPLIKSIVVGNVTDTVRERVFADTLAVSQTSAVQLELASKRSDAGAVADYVGFIHEANTLLALLYLDDPRYVPLPSTARADTGYYHQDQTHDITIVNQHWGAIKKTIPLEVKAKASVRDRGRYKALIIRGKMHLSIAGRYDPRHTLSAFTNVYERMANLDDYRTVDHATTTLLQLLRLYQQGSSDAVDNATSVTKFHDSRYVAPHYRGA